MELCSLSSDAILVGGSKQNQPIQNVSSLDPVEIRKKNPRLSSIIQMLALFFRDNPGTSRWSLQNLYQTIARPTWNPHQINFPIFFVSPVLGYLFFQVTVRLL